MPAAMRITTRRLAGGWGAALALASLAALPGCGGGQGPAIDAVPQTVQFNPAPALPLNGTASVVALASSGLAVTYASQTPEVCSVDPATGLVQAQAAGHCVIAASQPGNAHFAPATAATLSLPVQTPRTQTIHFGAVPALDLYGVATVSASASSGLAVRYSTSTDQVCSVDADSGLVTALAVGDCVIVAEQAGDAQRDPAPPVSLTLTVAAANVASAPGLLQGVSATLGDGGDTVILSATALSSSGGSPVTGYTAQSSPSGLSAHATTLPITVACPGSCAGYAFTVHASNAVGDGAASAPVHVLTTLDVTLRFFEPDTQPNDSIFVGSYTLDSTTGTVTALAGRLSESMTGSASTPMTQVGLTHQLSALSDGAGGLWVSSFALDTPNVFAPSGFADTLNGIYFGFPSAYNGATANSFVTIHVNLTNPIGTLPAEPLSHLVYGDCAPGGMMGATCMTGVSGGGTMGGYPVSQQTTRHR